MLFIGIFFHDFVLFHLSADQLPFGGGVSGRGVQRLSLPPLTPTPHSDVIKLSWDLGPLSFLQPPLCIGERQGWLGFCHRGHPVPSVSAWWLARAWGERRESAPCPHPAPSTPHSQDPHSPCPGSAPSTPHSRNPHGPRPRCFHLRSGPRRLRPEPPEAGFASFCLGQKARSRWSHVNRWKRSQNDSVYSFFSLPL